MLNKNTHKKTEKIVGKMPDPKNIFHLQHSSLDSFHTWVTHSTHESEGSAKKMLDDVIKKFPTHFKWRVVKLN